MTVSKILLSGYIYTQPLSMLQEEILLPSASTSPWSWNVPFTWLESLKRESIHSWEDLKKAFIDNFQGSLHWVATHHALAMCKQEPGEPLRSYVKRFFDTRATISNVSDEDIVHYFHDGITTQSLYRDFGRNRPYIVVKLRNMMQRWVDEEEQERSRFPHRNNDNNGKRNNDHGGSSNQRDPARKRKPDNVVGAIDRTPRGKKAGQPQYQFDKILHNKKCPIHPKSNHSMFECTIIRKSLQSPLPDAPKKKPNKDDNDNDKKDPDGFQKPENTVNVIFGGDPSFFKRAQKLLLQEILSVDPAIQRPLKYSEVPITFSREDQWTSFSEPGKFPLILYPVI